MVDERALEPKDITRLLVERVKAGDAEGVAALYEPDAILAFPPGKTTVVETRSARFTRTSSRSTSSSSRNSRCQRFASGTSL